MSEPKFYLLYTDKQQSRLLTTARNMEILESETQYYDSGVWFEYDTTENSNYITNEKMLKGIVFPKEPKKRGHTEEVEQPKITGFKWLS